MDGLRNNRGYGWYDFEPSEVFGDIMIDYSYVECSMASMTGLSSYLSKFPNDPRCDEISNSVRRGREFIKSIQRADGSWYGSWACCFAYGCWFGLEGLVHAGEPKNSPHIRRACEFLLKHQNPLNGGWGEDFSSCYDKSYARNGMRRFGDNGSSVVGTAWALLGLMAAEYEGAHTAIERGIKVSLTTASNGDWPQGRYSRCLQSYVMLRELRNTSYVGIGSLLERIFRAIEVVCEFFN